MNDHTNPPRQNLAVLRGTLTTDPHERPLPSGAVAVQFDVRTLLGGGPATTTVPVSWIDPPATDRAALVAGGEIVVIGTVNRRFFRVGGATQSRTEVIAESVVPQRRTRSVRSAIARAVDSLGD